MLLLISNQKISIGSRLAFIAGMVRLVESEGDFAVLLDPDRIPTQNITELVRKGRDYSYLGRTVSIDETIGDVPIPFIDVDGERYQLHRHESQLTEELYEVVCQKFYGDSLVDRVEALTRLTYQLSEVTQSEQDTRNPISKESQGYSLIYFQLLAYADFFRFSV